MHFIGNLFAVYDQCAAGDIDRTIIECLLRHLDELEDASIYDVADMANVSKTTIGRFIRRLGLESFTQFKFEMVQSFRKFKYHNRTIPAEYCRTPEETKANYLAVMESYLADLEKAADLGEMDRVVDAIHEAARVRFYMPHLGIALTSFETNLLVTGKDVLVLCDCASQEKDALELGPDTFLFLNSAEQPDSYDYGPIIQKARAAGCTLFLMPHGTSFYQDDADFTLPNRHWRTQIMGHYFAMYFDILSALYRKKYLED